MIGSCMLKCWAQVVPMVLGALGTVHTNVAQWLEIIPGHDSCSTYRKQCFWDLPGSCIKSCLLFKAMRWSKYSTPEAGFASGTCQSYMMKIMGLLEVTGYHVALLKGLKRVCQCVCIYLSNYVMPWIRIILESQCSKNQSQISISLVIVTS